jgi:hypothetical protein
MSHALDHVEPEAVSTRWCAICACGWRSGYRSRTFLWTHLGTHLGLALDDREGRLSLMHAVSTAIADAEAAQTLRPAWHSDVFRAAELIRQLERPEPAPTLRERLERQLRRVGDPHVREARGGQPLP